ncbi:MAG: hypothetical protein E7172_01265 [Firmicutes bacterium]|nr:hypothetical protein [Bacillota bacterium]
MIKEEKDKYKIMGLSDIKEELKKDWLNYVKDNSTNELSFIKVKLTAISMRRLSNAFTCNQIRIFLNDCMINDQTINEIEENICYFHKSRSEEYLNFMSKNFIKK